jgi:probable HAF family extracellular repeat protein
MEFVLKNSPLFASGWRAPVSLATVLMASSLAQAALPTFTCESLEDRADWPMAYSGDINNRGEITGRAVYDFWKEPGGVVWKRDSRAVPMSKDRPGAYVTTDINEAGQVVGYNLSAQPNEAFVWNAGTRKSLESLLGVAGAARAYGTNSNRQVVGESEWQAGSWKTHAVLWTDSHPVDLGALPGDEMSSAMDINDDGLVVGYSRPRPGTPERAVQWGPDGIVQLPSLLGHSRSVATKINRQGTVIGFAVTDLTATSRPVVWVHGLPHELGTLPGTVAGEARDINAAGKVVGDSTDFEGRTTPTYWPAVGRAPVDLNSLVGGGGCFADGAVWPLTHATGINDKGMVAAYSELPSGKIFAYRLVPKK